MEGLKGLLGFLTGRIEDVWLYVTTPKQTNAPYVSEIHWSKSNSKEHYYTTIFEFSQKKNCQVFEILRQN